MRLICSLLLIVFLAAPLSVASAQKYRFDREERFLNQAGAGTFVKPGAPIDKPEPKPEPPEEENAGSEEVQSSLGDFEEPPAVAYYMNTLQKLAWIGQAMGAMIRNGTFSIQSVYGLLASYFGSSSA